MTVVVTVLGLQLSPPLPLSSFPPWPPDEPSELPEAVGTATTVAVEVVVEVDWIVVVASLVVGGVGN